jgi:2-polyprenyl-3-methyl-5-hydroxy-6-metoxy-1,4-benzoquinol methylase
MHPQEITMDFYSVLSRYYDEVFPLSEECSGFVQKNMKGGESLLDAGCGTGELVLQLQDKGFQAHGFDLDEGMILSAASAAAKVGLPGNDLFRITDLTEIKNQYEANSQDVLSCLGNTLIHIPFNIQFQFLQDAASILKPGGLLILQILNYNNILHGGMKFPLIETENCIFRRSYEARELESELNFVTELEIKESGETYKNSIVHYPLFPETLMAALSMSGYAGWETYGSYNGAPAGEGKLALIVTAQVPD